ncbi:group 1 truncated hemoglobin [Leifsonia sp. H3M29-4]|uniref:group I truncated hemoglobin n=1 Tax=Salinibacterium metalliresistens TaxID=3031321 RepID=UPI0023DCDDE1|nr:group 1 truncated hemoglobin [Salinibacterium metalliresistens]MDF1478445.1 group 1 truncated hemoglobin [Salinibacterium metalliresistens]
MTLYSKLGGEPALAAAVDEFYERMQADPELSVWFHGVDLEILKAHQRAFLMVALGGPEDYSGRSMRNAHAGLHITDHAYTRALQHLRGALAAVGVEQELIERIVRPVEQLRAAIVEPR